MNGTSKRAFPSGAIDPRGTEVSKRYFATIEERLSNEADLCRNDGANDIAELLDEARREISIRRNTPLLHAVTIAKLRVATEALDAAHETMHQTTAVLTATDCADVAKTMAVVRHAITQIKEPHP